MSLIGFSGGFILWSSDHWPFIIWSSEIWLPPLNIHFLSPSDARHSDPTTQPTVANNGFVCNCCKGSALPTVDSTLWWIPTNLHYRCLGLQHTMFGFEDSPSWHTQTAGALSVVWRCQRRPYLSISLAMHPPLTLGYVCCHQRTTSGAISWTSAKDW